MGLLNAPPCSGARTRVLRATLVVLAVATVLSARAAEPPAFEKTPAAWRLNRVIVTPRGPKDGGDFGPLTPGSRTSGLQEAFDAAKAQGKDLYLSGGNWTLGQVDGVVYVLHETLRIPWMQDFHCDSGHCVIQYVPKTGDAIVLDSQVSCFYRFGLVVSNSDGAVMRLAPTTAGPDKFRVFTTTELHVNALVGGGGAWPGGEAFNSKLDTSRRWTGTGLWLDASVGSIDANRISVVEVVGCATGIRLSAKCTHNRLDATTVHLCQTHLELGGGADSGPLANRIEAHLDSQGIERAVGARVFGRDNLLTLSSGQMAPQSDVIFEQTATGNRLISVRLPHGITHRGDPKANAVWP
jgi:hypothetical protein